MAYERLNELLSGFENKPVKTTSAFVFKFGAILIAEELPNEDEPNQFSALDSLRQDSWRAFEGMLKKIKSAIEKHPNVFHLRSLDDSGALSVYGTRTGMLVDGALLILEIQLPRERQVYQDRDASEHFTVIWDGSYFAAYAPIEDVPVFTNIAHEFRELARKQIEAETTYKAPLFGPCPIWTDIIVVHTEESHSSGVPLVRSYEHEGDLYLILSKGADNDRFMRSLFTLSHRFWYGYYQLALERSEMIDLDLEIQNRFDEASQTVSTMATGPGWKVWQSAKLARRAALEIGKIHRLVVRYESACWGYDNQRREYVKRLTEVTYLAQLKRDTSESCRRDVRPPRSIGNALSFLEKQIELTNSVRYLILASLLGAIVGAIITGLLGFLKSK